MAGSLASWRGLKFKIQPIIKKLEGKLKESEKRYEEHIGSVLKSFFITIALIILVVIPISYFIARSIKAPIAVLTESVKALMNYSSAEQRSKYSAMMR